MIHFIDGVLEPLLWFLADWSLRWAVVIIVLAAWLALARPHRSATRHLLSMLALSAGLVLPLVPRWGPGFAMAAAKATQHRMVAAPPARSESAISEALVPAQLPKQKNADIAPAAAESAPAKPSPGQPGESWGLRRITILSVAILWILVVGLLSARWLVGWLLLGRMRRTAFPLQGASSQIFQACRAQLALRRQATLASHAAVCSPVTLGLYRPVILVPPSWSELPEQTQRASLLHELAHLARYDDWSALALELVRIVFFFHPLVHWLIGRIEYERELLCDETAVAHGIDPRDYAGVLLEFSRQAGRLRPPFLGPSYPLGFGHRRTVKARINRLLEANMTRWMSPLPVGRALVLAAIGLAMAIGLGSFRVRALEPQAASPPLTTAAEASAPKKGDGAAQKASPGARTEGGRSAGDAYHIEPFHVVKIEVLGADPAHAIGGNFLVEPDGKVDLGPFYDKVSVSNLTLEEAEAAIGNLLKKRGFSQVSVSVSLAGWVTKWLDDTGMRAPFHLRPLQLLMIRVAGADAAHPLRGEYVIEPGGKINLGPAYRRVALGGLTLEEAQLAIEKHLNALGFQAPKVSVTLAGWESDWHDLMKQGARRSGELPPKSGGRPDSLSYGNKTFAEWRDVLMSDLKPEVRIDAIKALTAFAAKGYGREAAESIVEAMKSYDIGGGDPEDRNVVGAASFAFSKIGSDGLPALIDELKHGNKNGRRFAILALGLMGRDSTNLAAPPIPALPKEAAPAVLDAFKDEDSYVRLRAISSMNALGVDHKLLIPALTEALKDADPNIRAAAAGKLWRMGKSAKPAMPALLAALKDDHVDARYYAALAMLETGVNLPESLPGKEAVPVLIAAFRENPVDRASIARVLGNIGPPAKDALPMLIEFMEQPKVKGTLAGDAVQEALRKISK
jgi:beta-lactamase regulating signal transducer with metallopeptidase domain/HEAT repeat protein/protein involved in polysaccharide export with SLBB domain